jgi:hypothetical protein
MRFSTTTFMSKRAATKGPMARAMVSGVVPGVRGTTNFSNLLCASAGRIDKEVKETQEAQEAKEALIS